MPEHDVRFICVSEGSDSARGNDEMLPFRSVMNEFYSRDISIKTRSVRKNTALRGETPGGIAPFGYKLVNKKFVVVPEQAEIARGIFKNADDGYTIYSIAAALCSAKIPTPNEQRKHIEEPKCKWSVQMLSYMLKNRVYIGETVSQKYVRKSYKIKKMIRPPESEWIVIPGTHEAIIDSEQFNRIQLWLKEAPRSRCYDATPLFSGLMVCSDCGRRMAYYASGDRLYYCCSGHTDMHYRGMSRPCSPHYIREDKLRAAVLAELNNALRTFNQREFVRTLNLKELMRTTQKRLDASQKRRDEMTVIMTRMLEQNAKGTLDTATYNDMMREFQTERAMIEHTIRDCEVTLKGNPTDNAKVFAELIKEVKYMRELSRGDTLRFIEKIVVHESEGPARQRAGREQMIEIYFKHVGMIGEAVKVA